MLRFSLPRMATQHRPWALWLALLIAVWGAIAPTLSQGLALAGEVPLVEICTSLGPRWVALTDSFDLPDSQQATTHIEHCPFFLHATDAGVPPHTAVFQSPDLSGESAKTVVVGQVGLFKDRLNARQQPRGPPRD